jgi:hypothetical protein
MILPGVIETGVMYRKEESGASGEILKLDEVNLKSEIRNIKLDWLSSI